MEIDGHGWLSTLGHAAVKNGEHAEQDAQALNAARKQAEQQAAARAVLMADGTARPIKDVAVGDQVESTDPATGETTAEPAVATY